MKKQIIFSILMILTTTLSAAEKEPVLTLDTSGHMAKIGDIIVSSDGKYLISCSNDKTIRVWDSMTKKEVRKILGQIGTGSEGKIFAIDLSLDDRYLAVGGFLAEGSGINDDLVGSIRIHDFKSGKLLKVLKSHSNVITDFAFSTDGRYLISGSTDKSVKVWDVRNGFKLLHTFKENNEQVYAVKIFRSSGDYRIISAGYDNRVVLYSLNSKKVIRSFTHTDKLQYLAMSDKYFAACGEGKEIKIFDYQLKLVTTITSETVPAGLAFSPDGKLLLAGTGNPPFNCIVYDTKNQFQKITTFSEHGNLTKAVTFLDNHTAITGGGNNQDIYFWDAYNGEEKEHIVGAGKTVWSVGIHGKELAFGNVGMTYINENTKLEKIFDLETFTVSTLSSEKGGFRFNRISTDYGGISLSHSSGGDYGNSDAVLVINKNNRETARIVRGATDGLGHKTYGLTGNGIIISGGANGHLIAYDTGGKKVADFIGHTGEVWSITVENDWLVSGSSDQTIKLWNLQELKDGKSKIYPILNLFISKDDEWVVWSKSGYYNASIGGDRYTGYHINQGPEKEAQFYGSDKFFTTYFRPDIIQYIVRLGSEAKAIAYAGREKKVETVAVTDVLPPNIEITSPSSRYLKTSEDNLVVDFWVIPQSEHEIMEISILINGRPLAEERGMKKKTAGKRGIHVVKSIPLPENYNTITLLAKNRYASGNPETIEVEKEIRAVDIYKPSLYLLSIGVSRYANPDFNLDYADDDAQAMVEIFKQQEGKLYNRVSHQLLMNEDATKDNILDGIDWLDKEATQRDVVVLFIAGHGVNDARGSFYFMSHEADPDKLRRTAVKWIDFEDIVLNLPSKVILLADACHAGNIMGGKRRSIDFNAAIKSIVAAGTGQVIMTATTGNAVSFEDARWKHGAFTKALIDGLQEGKADYDKNGLISIKEVDLYVTNRVKELTKGQQKPTTIIPGSIPDFPLIAR